MSSSENQALEILSPDRGVTASSTSNSGQVTDTLKRAMERGHLVSPSTTCPSLPIGCEVAFSAVLIDAKSSDVYKIGGQLGLAKPALDKIAKAVGISWDAVQSRRTDDGSDSYYASYKAVGFYRHFDGTLMQVVGEKQMDLHDDSETAKKLSPGELSMQRRFIAEHAETKARLRAIRSLGIQTSYTEGELQKPFIVAKLMLTGRVKPEDDPTGELQRILTHNISQSMLGGSRMLFGDDATKGLPSGDDHSHPHPETEPATAPAPVATAPAASQLKSCSPDECYGKESAGHVRACSIPLDSSTAAAPTPIEEAVSAAWVIDVGARAGLKVNDPRVSVDDLNDLLKHYEFLKSGQNLPSEMVGKIMIDEAYVTAEVARRKKG